MTYIPPFPFNHHHFGEASMGYEAAPVSMEHLERGADTSMYQYSQEVTAEHELQERRKVYQARAETAGYIRSGAYLAMAGICGVLADRHGRRASESFSDAEHYVSEINRRQRDELH